MDRPVRPLFPKGWFIDTQIIANVDLVRQGERDRRARDDRARRRRCTSPTSSGAARSPAFASAASTASSSRTRRSPSARSRDMDIVVAASKDAIMMVEGEMQELQEDIVIDALLFAHAGRPAADRAPGAPARRATARRSARSRRRSPTRPWPRRSRSSRGIASPRRCTIKDKKQRRDATSALHLETSARS